MYLDGSTLRQIAAIHRTSHETIRQILNNHSIATDHTRERKPGYRYTDTLGYTHVFLGIGQAGATKDGWILEHRLTMQEHLGRELRKWEVVHHRNRDKGDNRLENLELTSVTDHSTCMACPYYAFYIKTTGQQGLDKKAVSLIDLTT
jgi:hypothetical protein